MNSWSKLLLAVDACAICGMSNRMSQSRLSKPESAMRTAPENGISNVVKTSESTQRSSSWRSGILYDWRRLPCYWWPLNANVRSIDRTFSIDKLPRCTNRDISAFVNAFRMHLWFESKRLGPARSCDEHVLRDGSTYHLDAVAIAQIDWQFRQNARWTKIICGIFFSTNEKPQAGEQSLLRRESVIASRRL